MSFKNHLSSHQSLITPYEKVRAVFIALALEKNRKASPFVEEAKVLKTLAALAQTPQELLQISEIQDSLLTAAGVSNKAKKYLHDEDRKEAIQGLIDNFLEPSSHSFVDELVYRFLLTRGDALGGSMRNIAGFLGEWRFTRILISTLSVMGIEFQYLDSKTKNWMQASLEPDIERQIKGLHWFSSGQERTLIYNLTVPTVKKNVDICLFNCLPSEINFGKSKDSAHHNPEKYLALGELKGGIDPAGADEHWKTANSALERIRIAFSNNNCTPFTFFIGAAIEAAMAQEIYKQLENNTLSNAANLTNEEQVVSLCNWLIQL
ncbi:AvaI/BsoBI family type II restriction endonuclease [Spirulina sp. CS-785/01]|uniref:AvaI/BsoBI family type II restriction endonuclease n=1 Tax=Spirulina sp. CS-785/01 TaxID=3021716 RepID=UPI002330FA78|nr:AvaI/BsoBI family type II restriction endonuclease [Spirulina sp. CS-785/01]MDB9313832.1 AvaI/BsoBI family type II restriction endonuclease [Spirulina sp. CS-785/01]